MSTAEIALRENGRIPADIAIRHSFDDWIPVLQEVVGLAEAIADSPFVPDGLRGSVPAVAAAILTGRELGIPPMTALANIHLIKGKTGLSALLMRALIQSKGHQWEDVQVTDTRVVLRGRRRGETEWGEASFDADQAKRANIPLHPYPQDKLYARASVRLARRKFADVIAGMPYSAEELEDGELGQLTDTTDPPAEPPKPAQRTAQRRQRPAERPTAAAPAAATARTGAPARAATVPSGLPPLPGEDEPAQPVAPVTEADRSDRHRKLVGVVRAHFKRLGYTDAEDEQRLRDTARLAGVAFDVGSTNELDEDELSLVADTLAKCKDRERLTALLEAADNPQAAGDGA